MFGYIMPLLSELKMKDYEIFRSYYCGLCCSIKNKFGNLPRLGLNYDATFFAILMDSINAEETDFFETSCIKHPIKKRECVKPNKALDYATDLNFILIYYKVLDDTLDDKDLKSISLSYILKPYLSKITYPILNDVMANNLNKLHKLESNGNFISLDEICDPFSTVIGEIFKDCPFKLNNDSLIVRDNLYKFGYYLGKWIYLIDALDDLKDDMKDSKFNPINKVYNNKNLSYEELLPNIKEKLDFTLMSLAANCSEMLKSLPIKKNTEIIDNVINLGLLEKYMNIFSKL